MGRNTVEKQKSGKALFDKTIVYLMQPPGNDYYGTAEQSAAARALRIFKKGYKVGWVTRAHSKTVITSALGQSTRDTRIHLCAHANEGIFAGFADPADLAKHLKDHGLRRAKRIVLSGCSTAAGTYAAKFHEALYSNEPKIFCIVAGYTHPLARPLLSKDAMTDFRKGARWRDIDVDETTGKTLVELEKGSDLQYRRWGKSVHLLKTKTFYEYRGGKQVTYFLPDVAELDLDDIFATPEIVQVPENVKRRRLQQ